MKISEVRVQPPNTRVDVLAWVREVGPLEHVRSRDGRDARTREILLCDESGSISLTLWQAQADNFTESQKVIALRSIVVREFRQGVRSLSGVGGHVQYEMSPSCAGAETHQDHACPYASPVGVVEDRSVLMGLPDSSHGPNGSDRTIVV